MADSISDACLHLIMDFEGKRHKAYGRGPYSIGYGHTAGVRKGDTADVIDISEDLLHDVTQAAVGVLRLLKVEPTQGQLDALTSFAYNVGLTSFGNSSVLKFLNQGSSKKAGEALLMYNRDNGIEVEGLARRRAAEKAVFDS